MPSGFNSIPEILLKLIYSFLSREDFRTVRLVSKFFAPSIAFSEQWEKLLEQDFGITFEMMRDAGVKGAPIAQRTYIQLNTLVMLRTHINVNHFGQYKPILSVPRNPIAYLKILMNGFEPIDVIPLSGREHLNYASSAALAGKLVYLDYFLNQSKQLDQHQDLLFKCALVSGDNETVHYLMNRYHLALEDSHLNQAALSGSVPLVKELITHHGLALTSKLMPAAVKSGSVKLVKYLSNENQLGIDCSTVYDAASHGRLPMLRYLIDKLKLPIPNPDYLLANCCRNSKKINPHIMLEIIEYLIAAINMVPNQDEDGLFTRDPLLFATLGANIVACKYLLDVHGLRPNGKVLAALVDLRQEQQRQFRQLYQSYENNNERHGQLQPA